MLAFHANKKRQPVPTPAKVVAQSGFDDDDDGFTLIGIFGSVVLGIYVIHYFIKSAVAGGIHTAIRRGIYISRPAALPMQNVVPTDILPNIAAEAAAKAAVTAAEVAQEAATAATRAA